MRETTSKMGCLNDDTKRNTTTTFTRFFAPLLFQPLHHFNSIRTILQNICSNKMENRHVISVWEKETPKRHRWESLDWTAYNTN